MYYQQDEQPLRLVAYYSFNGVAGVFGGLLGYAIGHIHSGLAQWQYVFLIFGAISLAWGVALTLLLPDLPSSARFLTQREKVVAVERVAANRQGVKNRHFKMYQVWQAVGDPKTWILFVMSVAAQIPNAAQSSVSEEINLFYIFCIFPPSLFIHPTIWGVEEESFGETTLIRK